MPVNASGNSDVTRVARIGEFHNGFFIIRIFLLNLNSILSTYRSAMSALCQFCMIFQN